MLYIIRNGKALDGCIGSTIPSGAPNLGQVAVSLSGPDVSATNDSSAAPQSPGAFEPNPNLLCRAARSNVNPGSRSGTSSLPTYCRKSNRSEHLWSMASMVECTFRASSGQCDNLFLRPPPHFAVQSSPFSKTKHWCHHPESTAVAMAHLSVGGAPKTSWNTRLHVRKALEDP